MIKILFLCYRQDLPGMMKSLKSSHKPSFNVFCVSISNLPKIYQYFGESDLCDSNTRIRRSIL